MEFEVLAEVLHKKEKLELQKAQTKALTRKLIAEIITDNKDKLQVYRVPKVDRLVYGMYVKDDSSKGGYWLVR